MINSKLGIEKKFLNIMNHLNKIKVYNNNNNRKKKDLEGIKKNHLTNVIISTFY